MKEHIIWHHHKITKKDRAEKNAIKPCVLWFTGLSGSGKSTIASAVEEMLFGLGKPCYLLDGDNVRHGLNGDLGFSDQDREENIRRIGEVAKLFADAGLIVITAFISPFKEDRTRARMLLEEGEFIEVYINTSLEACEKRDPKGLYQKARNGEIREFTGISSPYEAPENPEIEVLSESMDVEACANQIIEYLKEKGYVYA